MTGLRTITRLLGDAFNFAILAVFGWATMVLTDRALYHYGASTPLPSFDRAALEALWADPERLVSLWHIAATWIFAVAAAGSAWMTVLGMRWTYHFLLRTLVR